MILVWMQPVLGSMEQDRAVAFQPNCCNSAAWNSELTILQPDSLLSPLVHGSTWAAAVPSSPVLAWKTQSRGRACPLLWLLNAAIYSAGFCRADSYPVRKWAERPLDSCIPGAEDHKDRVPAADIPFLYYSRLNNSMATACCNEGMQDRGVRIRLNFASWPWSPHSNVTFSCLMVKYMYVAADFRS